MHIKNVLATTAMYAILPRTMKTIYMPKKWMHVVSSRCTRDIVHAVAQGFMRQRIRTIAVAPLCTP